MSFICSFSICIHSLVDLKKSPAEIQPYSMWTSSHNLPVTDLCFTGSRLADTWVWSVSLDKSLRVHQLVTGQILLHVLFPVPLSTVTVSPDASCVYVGSAIHHQFFRVNAYHQQSSSQHPGQWQHLSVGIDGQFVHNVDPMKQETSEINFNVYSFEEQKQGKVESLALSTDTRIVLSAGWVTSTPLNLVGKQKQEQPKTTKKKKNGEEEDVIPKDNVVLVWDSRSCSILRQITSHRGELLDFGFYSCYS